MLIESVSNCSCKMAGFMDGRLCGYSIVVCVELVIYTLSLRVSIVSLHI